MKKESKDLSEFLGRAGVSIIKAGATAAIGSAFAAAAAAGLSMFAAGAVPLAIMALIVVVGFIGAAAFVDAIDEGLNVKEGVAKWAR